MRSTERRLRVLSFIAGVAVTAGVAAAGCGTRTAEKNESDAKAETLPDAEVDAADDVVPCPEDTICLGPLPPPDLPA